MLRLPGLAGERFVRPGFRKLFSLLTIRISRKNKFETLASFSTWILHERGAMHPAARPELRAVFGAPADADVPINLAVATLDRADVGRWFWRMRRRNEAPKDCGWRPVPSPCAEWAVVSAVGLSIEMWGKRMVV
ncbi:MAG: hypothetical protein DMG22_15245 [Acidobacteria bacterium]|nr:MAG: hypothetical protein DMG22_15245 [Acidobacteriota bacterium]